jgi:hypothetical protein
MWEWYGANEWMRLCLTIETGGRERSIGDTRNHYYFHNTLQHLALSILTLSKSHDLCDIM